MANTVKTMNVYQKLAQAKLMFLDENVKKTGKNMHLEFKYFELEDIIPPIIRIFSKVGLLGVTHFGSEYACLDIYNTENPEEKSIQFQVPWRENDPITNQYGDEVTNRLQVLGASVTYLRRYLYMMAMDIIEEDMTDAALRKDETKRTAPVTAENRKEMKEKLTGTEPLADEKKLKKLKALCKLLRKKDESQDEFIQKIAMKTDGFTRIEEKVCDELIPSLHELLAAYDD